MRKNIMALAVMIFIATTASVAQGCPVYSEQSKKMIYQVFKKDVLVKDAHIHQDGCKLSLALIVNSATNLRYARSLGDRFVRMTKSFGSGPAPGREIGSGIYSFLVGIYTSGKRQIAMGAKVSFATRLTW